MKTNKLMKMIIAIIIIAVALGIVICEGITVSQNSELFSHYRNVIENAKYLKQTAKYMYENDEWDTKYAAEIFNTYDNPYYDPEYSGDNVPVRITNEYEDVVEYLDSVIASNQKTINTLNCAYVPYFLFGIGMFLIGVVLLASCFLKGKEEAQPAEGKATAPKQKEKAQNTQKAQNAQRANGARAASAPAAPITYLECPACHGRIPAIKGQAIITCEKCGAAYQNPYME